MKKCNTCQEEKPVEDFARNYRTKDKKAGKCKMCQRVYWNNYYRNTPGKAERHIRLTTEGKRRKRKEVLAVLAQIKNKPCMDCGGVFKPWQMDFDHVRGEKQFEISNNSHNLEKILGEIPKCDLVCSNCHRDRTHRRQQY